MLGSIGRIGIDLGEGAVSRHVIRGGEHEDAEEIERRTHQRPPGGRVAQICEGVHTNHCATQGGAEQGEHEGRLDSRNVDGMHRISMPRLSISGVMKSAPRALHSSYRAWMSATRTFMNALVRLLLACAPP